MIKCPNCGAIDDDIVIQNEFNEWASIEGRAGVSADCECTECGCTFTVSIEGDIDGEYNYDDIEVKDEED